MDTGNLLTYFGRVFTRRRRRITEHCLKFFETYKGGDEISKSLDGMVTSVAINTCEQNSLNTVADTARILINGNTRMSTIDDNAFSLLVFARILDDRLQNEPWYTREALLTIIIDELMYSNY